MFVVKRRYGEKIEPLDIQVDADKCLLGNVDGLETLVSTHGIEDALAVPPPELIPRQSGGFGGIFEEKDDLDMNKPNIPTNEQEYDF